MGIGGIHFKSPACPSDKVEMLKPKSQLHPLLQDCGKILLFECMPTALLCVRSKTFEMILDEVGMKQSQFHVFQYRAAITPGSVDSKNMTRGNCLMALTSRALEMPSFQFSLVAFSNPASPTGLVKPTFPPACCPGDQQLITWTRMFIERIPIRLCGKALLIKRAARKKVLSRNLLFQDPSRPSNIRGSKRRNETELFDNALPSVNQAETPSKNARQLDAIFSAIHKENSSL
ncbi:hypothetical protein BYT27DRAFT_7259202 [Phlegmacium glaucopus]|nr:hypothetical protein BYT27DRAFT_7259202 [Phlegmacium glaucopus]